MSGLSAESEKPPAPSVLVIDDEGGLREMLMFGLPKRGYRVDSAASGEEGVVKIGAGSFDLVICDIMMPGMGGVEALQRIKEISPETQIIMATGFATVETAIESMKRGAFDYITKPYSLPQLCSILEKAMEWRRMRARVDHLEELNRLKDEFISTISHELRTPITIILGYAGILRDLKYSPEEIRKGLSTIELKSKGLLQIVTNIIDLASVTARRDPLAIERCNLTDVAGELVNVFRPLAEAKNISLNLQAPPNPVEVETDRTKVRQILLNLLDNAIKFTQEGHVTIRIEAAEDRNARIVVEDTGIGIEGEHMPLIFQEFRQVDGSRTRRFGGTGLGLAVAHRFAELLGGKIAVESQAGKGSTFTVLLPGRVSEAGNGGTSSNPPAALGEERPKVMLVVDDDAGITRLFQNLLTREGYSVSTAEGGREALSRMHQQKPDVLLLDLMMPDLDGFDVLASMSALPELAGVRVFIMTAKTLSADERARLLTRAEMIIQKGSKDLPEILALLNQTLKRQSAA